MRRLLTTLLVAILWVFAPLNALADVNINTATSSQLETLPGIGPAKASAIIQYRTDHGPFTTVAQLDNVPGIGPATMANLSGMVSVGDGVTVEKGAANGTATSAAAPSDSRASSGSAAGKVDINGRVALGISDVAARKLGSSTLGFLDSLGNGKDNNVVDGNPTDGQKIVTEALKQVTGLRGRLGAFEKKEERKVGTYNRREGR